MGRLTLCQRAALLQWQPCEQRLGGTEGRQEANVGSRVSARATWKGGSVAVECNSVLMLHIGFGQVRSGLL